MDADLIGFYDILKKGNIMSLLNKTPLKDQVYTIIKDRIMSQQ